MAMKLYAIKGCALGYRARIVAKYCGVDLEVPEYNHEKDDNHSTLGKCCSVLETKEGTIYGPVAPSRFIGRGSQLVTGTTPFEAALIDQWVDFANELELPCLAWVLPIILQSPAIPQAVKKAKADIRKLLAVLNNHLLTKTFFVGERVTLADITIFTVLLDCYIHVLDPGFRKEFKNLNRWFVTMANQPAVLSVVGEVKLCEKAEEPKFAEVEAAAAPKEGGGQQKKEKGQKAEKKPQPEKKKEEKKKEEKKEEKPAEQEGDDEEEGEEKKEKKAPNVLDLLPASKLKMDDWKRVYSNEDTKTKAIPWFWENYDPEGYSIWFCRYKYVIDATQIFMAANLLGGFIQRLDPLRKYGFGSLIIFNEQKPFEIEGFWLFRGKEIPKEMLDCDDCELYSWTRADPVADRERINEFLCWEGNFGGKKFNQAKIFK